MGIKTNGDWFQVVHKNRQEEAERLKKGMTPRFAEQVYHNPENIKCSPAAKALIASRCTPRDEAGGFIASTERGRRRSVKRHQGR